MKHLSPSAQAIADVEALLGLTKLSARAGVNRLRGLYDAAHKATDEAQRHHIFNQIGQLESRAGDILHGRHLPQGSQLRVLGAGGEGVAQHVLTPHGSRVQKTLDPTSSLFNPAVNENRRSLVGKETPGFAQTLAHGQAPHTVGGHAAPTFQYEYVPGTQVKPNDPGVQQLQQQAHQGQHGMAFADTRAGNMLRDSRTGQVKGIDYTPVSQHDMLPHDQRIPSSNRLDDNIDMWSPTGRQFGPHSTQAMPGGRDQINQAIVQGASGKGMTDAEQKSYIGNEYNRADKHYERNLLQQAYGGKAPQAFRATQVAPRPNAAPPATPPGFMAPSEWTPPAVQAQQAPPPAAPAQHPANVGYAPTAVARRPIPR